MIAWPLIVVFRSIFNHQGHISQVGSEMSLTGLVTHLGSIATHDADKENKA